MCACSLVPRLYFPASLLGSKAWERGWCACSFIVRSYRFVRGLITLIFLLSLLSGVAQYPSKITAQ